MGSGQGRKTPGFWADSKINLGFGAARDATRTAKKKKKKTKKSQTVHALSQFLICIFRGWWWVSKKVNS